MALPIGNTPYITPDVLTQAPTGISWASIPNARSSPAEQLAEQLNICQRASADVDECTQVPLRATVDTETVVGPGDLRFQIRPNGVARIILSRPPVVSIVSAGVCSAQTFPSTYTSVATNQVKIELPLMGVYGTTAPGAGGDSGGQSILVAPGVANWWWGGRYGTELQVTYINGWPHGSLLAAASAGATSVRVDDVCGWLGANGTIYDPNAQEAATVTAVTPDTTGALNGPGTLTLASGLLYGHAAGKLFTTIPSAVMDATVLFAVNQALRRGGTSIALQSAAPHETSLAQHTKMDNNCVEAEMKLLPFRRIL